MTSTNFSFVCDWAMAAKQQSKRIASAFFIKKVEKVKRKKVKSKRAKLLEGVSSSTSSLPVLICLLPIYLILIIQHILAAIRAPTDKNAHENETFGGRGDGRAHGPIGRVRI